MIQALLVCLPHEFSRRLSGSCHTPLAAHAIVEGGKLWLRGFLADSEGRDAMRGDAHGTTDDPEQVGQSLADQFLARGAAEILARTAG